MCDKQLVEAAQENNFSKVVTLLEDGANANVQVYCIERKHLAPIYCTIDDLETQVKLLNQEDKSDFKKQSLLHSVTNAEIAKILILYGANLNAMDCDYNSPLITAVRNKRDLDTVRVLLVNGCRVNDRNCSNQTALFFAIANNSLETVLELIKFGARVGKGFDGEYLKAVESVEVAKVLLEQGINIKPTNILCSIIRSHKSYQLIKFLITHGANVHGWDEYTKPPIAYVFSHPNKIDLLNELVKKRVDLDIRINDSSLLHLYCLDEVETLRLLLQHGADVNITDSKGNSPLHEAILLNKDFNIIYTLLMFGADVNALNHDKQTPLFIAIKHKNDDYIIDELLKHNASVNVICRDQLAVIHMADDMNLINKLLLYGGDINCVDCKGQTPLYYALRRKNSEIIKAMLKLGVSVNFYDSMGRTPLLYAIEYASDIEDINELIVNGARLNSKDAKGRSCLHYAIIYGFNEDIGRIDLVEKLLKYDVDINCMDKLGNTPLYYAVTNARNVLLIEKLINHGGDAYKTFDVVENSLLHVCDNIDVFNILLKYCLDLYSRNKGHQTTLLYYISLRSRKPKFVELIIALLHLYIDCNADNIDNYQIMKHLWHLGMSHPFENQIAPNVIYYYFTCGAHYNIEIFSLLNKVLSYLKIDPLCILFKINDRFESDKYNFIINEITRMKNEKITKSLSLYDFLTKTFLNSYILSAHSLINDRIIDKYPVYSVYIKAKIANCARRSNLLKTFNETFVNCCFGNKLNIYLIHRIAEYLSNIDMYKCIKANHRMVDALFWAVPWNGDTELAKSILFMMVRLEHPIVFSIGGFSHYNQNLVVKTIRSIYSTLMFSIRTTRH